MYKDENWLRYQREEQHKSLTDIADECGVSRRTIAYYCDKYNIGKRRADTGMIDVEILCHACKKPTTKKLSYLKRRIRQGHLDFYCSDDCRAIVHSARMTGDRNPNFEGTWHGPDPSTMFTKDQLRSNAIRYIEKLKETGKFEERMEKLHAGHARFFATPEGKAIRSQNGVKACKSHADKHRTSIEIKMAEELNRRCITFEEQKNIGDKFLLDFYLPEYKIVIECDGDYWHTRPEAIRRDKRKNAYVKACGFSMYRFWEHEINADVEACVDVVLAEINESEAI